MEHYQDLAIILKSITFGERDRMVTALTENHGRVVAHARNAIQSRRFGGCLDLFSASDWTLVIKPSSDIHRLNEARIRHSYEGIRSDFEKLTTASVLSEIMLKISPPNEPCRDLFLLHSNALRAVEEAKSSETLVILLNVFLLKILQWCGNTPSFFRCLHCQKQMTSQEEAFSCSVPEAGWICHRCRITKATGFSMHLPIEGLIDALRSFQHPIRQSILNVQGSIEDHHRLFGYLHSLLVYHVPGFDQFDTGKTALKSLKLLDLESSLPSLPTNLQ